MTFAGCPNTGFPCFHSETQIQRFDLWLEKSPLDLGPLYKGAFPGITCSARLAKQSLQQIMGESLAGLAAASINACQLSTSSVSWAGPIRLDSWSDYLLLSPPPRERKITQANESLTAMKRSFLKWRNTHLEWTHGKPYLKCSVLFVSTKSLLGQDK